MHGNLIKYAINGGTMTVIKSQGKTARSFLIILAVQEAMKNKGHGYKEIKEVKTRMRSGNYENLVNVAREYITIVD